MIDLFFSYSHKDEALRDELETHLSMLKRQGIISTWHDRRIGAGAELHGAISERLESADIVLLLVSPYFLASDYCYDIELKRALERHETGDATVIPVILHPCDWKHSPFGKLRATPRDGRPISKFPNLHEAFLEVVSDIRAAAAKTGTATGTPTLPSTPQAAAAQPARSSNLRVKRTFSDADYDKFVDEAFAYIANFFEESLQELERRNGHLESRLRRHGETSFSAVVYADGSKRTSCRIWTAGRNSFAGDIAYSSDESSSGNSFNESMHVKHDGYTMGFQPLGMAYLGFRTDEMLSPQGAAEYFWTIFVRPLQ